MSTALGPFRTMQIGPEVTKGTGVAATKKLIGDFFLLEEIDRYYSKYPRGYRATVGGTGVSTRKGTKFSGSTELTFEEFLWPLISGVKTVSPVATNTTDNTWTIAPELTGAPTLKSFTAEFAESDGSTNHIYTEGRYGLTSGFKIESHPTDVAKLTWDGFARARQSDTITPALSAYTGREEVKGSSLIVSIDTDAYANVGVTPVAGIVRSASFECMTGVAPDYTADGRSDQDFNQHKYDSIGAKLGLTVELNSVAAGYYANWRAGQQLYVQLKWTGSLMTVGVLSRSIKINGSYRIPAAPTFSQDGDFVLMALACEAVFDSTASKIIDFVVVNELAAA